MRFKENDGLKHEPQGRRKELEEVKDMEKMEEVVVDKKNAAYGRPEVKKGKTFQLADFCLEKLSGLTLSATEPPTTPH